MKGDIKLHNECVFRNILDTCNTSKKYEKKSFLQYKKVLFNDAVKKEKMDFIVEFIVILINGPIVLIAIQCMHIKRKDLIERKRKH